MSCGCSAPTPAPGGAAAPPLDLPAPLEWQPDLKTARIRVPQENRHPLAQPGLAARRLWVEKAVVGLNLCPFANAVLKKERLHIQVSEATEPLALLEDLRTELKRLLDAPETEIETSLLVCPRMLADFLEFNDFLDMAEALRESGIRLQDAVAVPGAAGRGGWGGVPAPPALQTASRPRRWGSRS